MSTPGAAPNGSLINLYLPNGQENIVKCDDLSSGFRLQYPEVASINAGYLMPSSLSGI